MKFRRLLLLFALLVPAVVLARPVKVACVGNSITFGYTIPESEKYSYPSQLQLFLYSERPHITAVPILLNESSRRVMSLASLATEVPVPIDKPTWA